ncbi:hypothetical protein CYLTODRAFT_343865 [Cylindrobasidium torrendii FP15055 ss-10]|uniref:DUF4112 domain-containing protein n=1 Tax=Cylindrobasidium torrendii FP15055 ss-10 TaxID=1314674 RepID=A0A0D7BPT2_9AGAR|nr:hypothetical protein CYLTODRAFT_343865 [Cylindrobasidium torrendii FP15055 ss-10]
MQFGLDSFIGAIIPGAGDLVGVILGLYQVMLSWFFGVSANALIMMLFYVFCDMFVGIIPIVGDLLDVAFKANIYNLRILEKELKKSVWAPVVVIPSSHDWMPRRKKQPAAADSSNKRFFGLF